MKEKRIDYMYCLNMGFFIYVLLLVAFIIVLSTMNYYQKNPILLHMSYIEDTEKSAAKAAITSESFVSTRTPVNMTAQKNTGAGKNKTYTSLIKAETKEIPVNYTEINYPGMNIPIYTFFDEAGSAQYRLFAEREINGETVKGYIAARQVLEGMIIKYDYDLESDFVDTAKENYGHITPLDASTDITGDLIKVYGYTGLYYYQNDDVKEYYIYGFYPGHEPGFFIANSSGNMIPGTIPVDLTEKEN